MAGAALYLNPEAKDLFTGVLSEDENLTNNVTISPDGNVTKAHEELGKDDHVEDEEAAEDDVSLNVTSSSEEDNIIGDKIERKVEEAINYNDDVTRAKNSSEPIN